MHTIQLHPYISLGLSVRFLLDVQESTWYTKKPGRTSISCQQHLDRVQSLLTDLGLKVTRQAFSAELFVLKLRLDQEAKKGDFQLGSSNATQISERTESVMNVLRFEALTLYAYVVTDKRMSVEKLLSDTGGLFGEGVFAKLPDLAQYDFSQAGRCVAIDVPTAAAFHALRGTEGVLKHYHSLLVPGSTLTLPMWAAMVTELRKTNFQPQIQKELLDNLDNIRVNFRNPTQHPEKTYDNDEVQDLYSLCISVVNSMIKDLTARGLGPATEEDIPF